MEQGPQQLFLARLQLHAKAVESHLAAILSAQIAQSPATGLGQAMHYGALGPGKRLRPFLLLESAALFGVPAADAVDAAAALECVHAYSLIHDDLPAMDNDDMRRGRPTVHKAFDEATAILAGDSLLTFAFEILARPVGNAKALVAIKLVHGLAQAAGAAGMAGGQMLDLQAQKQPLGLAQIATMQAMKTGALIEFACEAGALLGQAAPAERAALKAFGQTFGEAFQIADDLLDAEGDSAVVGKATAKDAAAGKSTYLTEFGVVGARAELDKRVDRAIEVLKPFGSRAEMLEQAAQFIAIRRS